MDLWVGAWEQVPVSLRQLGKGCCRTGLAATTALGDVGKMTQSQGALRCIQGALLLMLGGPVVPPRRQPIPNDSKAFQDYRTAKADNRVTVFFFFFLHTAVAILPCLCLKPTLHPSLTQLSGAHLCCLHSAASQQPSFQSLQENGPPASPAGYSIASAFTFKNSVS